MVKATTLIDDVDGTAEAKERFFSVGGMDYAIDLSDENFRRFLRAIEPWRTRARVARKRRKNPTPVVSAEDRSKIRLWAKSRNLNIAPRGRFPAHIVKAYYDEVGHD